MEAVMTTTYRVSKFSVATQRELQEIEAQLRLEGRIVFADAVRRVLDGVSDFRDCLPILVNRDRVGSS